MLGPDVMLKLLVQPAAHNAGVTAEMPVMPPVIPQVVENGNMKIALDSEEIARIVKALEQYHAYLRSQQPDDSR